jgi:ferrous iron transport protein A
MEHPLQMIGLDVIARGQLARIVAVDWAAFVPEEAKRLQALGVEAGAMVSVAHRGIFAGRDPLALRIGRMVVAVRRVHARAISVMPEALS